MEDNQEYKIMKRLSITIGIPAYNEEANIANLLTNLVNQKGNTYHIEKIIVISDGSTDSTVKSAKSINDKRILVYAGKNRLGKSARLNQIFKRTNSDLLIMIDADCQPGSDTFIHEIASAAKGKSDIGLMSVNVQPLPTNNSLLSLTIKHSYAIKHSLYDSIQDTNPIYNCIGRAMVYTSKLYTQLSLPTELIAEDAYACLYCIKNGLGIVHNDNTVIYFALPANVIDYLSQSTRFYNSKIQLNAYFGQEFVSQCFKIPKSLLIKQTIGGVLSSPLLSLIYICLLGYSKALSLIKGGEKTHLWHSAITTKSMTHNI